MTKDKMVGWHHRLDGYEFEQGPRDNERQAGLLCFCSWGLKESDVTKRVSNTTTYHSNARTLSVPPKETLYSLMCVCVCMMACAQSCPTLFNPMDYSPPGSSVHGIL